MASHYYARFRSQTPTLFDTPPRYATPPLSSFFRHADFRQLSPDIIFASTLADAATMMLSQPELPTGLRYAIISARRRRRRLFSPAFISSAMPLSLRLFHAELSDFAAVTPIAAIIFAAFRSQAGYFHFLSIASERFLHFFEPRCRFHGFRPPNAISLR
jgi:hypothetical protein